MKLQNWKLCLAVILLFSIFMASQALQKHSENHNQSHSQSFKPAISTAITQTDLNSSVSNPSILNSPALNSASLSAVLEKLYPNCSQEMFKVYVALGVQPLLEYHLEKTSEAKRVAEFNKILQVIFLRPAGVQRYQLEDESYLALVQQRLEKEYKKAGLKILPSLDAKAARQALLNPNLWNIKFPNDQPRFDAVLLMGSSYQDYLNRQDYFFNLLAEKKIILNLNSNNKFPVFLLGGDRPLNSAMNEDPIAAILKEKNQPQNEQYMMQHLFEEALKRDNRIDSKTKASLTLKSTHSPKEAEGRPTTAGTLSSLMKLLKNKPEIKKVLVISTPPFIRYQELVTKRQFLTHALPIEVVAGGPDLKTEIATHPELAKRAFIAISMDNLAREAYEFQAIEKLKIGVKKSLTSKQIPDKMQ